MANREARTMMLREAEWWLFRQALPKFIAKQGFRSHTLARMFPFLLTIAAWSATYGGVPWINARDALLVSTPLSVILWLFVTRARRRPPPPVPAPLAVSLVLAYFLAAPLLYVAYALASLEDYKYYVLENPNASSGDVVRNLATNAAVLLVIYALTLGVANIATRYGLVALFIHAFRHVFNDLRNSVGLLGHALPGVLIITTFLFFTPEVWQVAKNLNWWHLSLLFTLFAAVVVLAIRTRLREELQRLETAISAPELEQACHGTPLAPVAAELAPSTHLIPLRSAEERNILLVLTIRQLIRATVFGVGVFLFFEIFGLITITDSIAQNWSATEEQNLPAFISSPMLRVSALLAGFSAMHFAILSITDSESRQRYFDPVLKEIKRVLAVRAIYLKLREMPPNPAPDATDARPLVGAGTAGA
ncbi:hypothetical protein MXD61_07235 [Frankia sp. AgPm24]|uniref:hypothetical protein n=1 Tax=Frankia sp. AgPm24 TaxID=631128 RepID=UPI00200D7061|nr:hypothetical protein [Frankia sp. AgPm24]MCK9921684.1 hypothetical protein [Frankia sp. AgPm24]